MLRMAHVEGHVRVPVRCVGVAGLYASTQHPLLTHSLISPLRFVTTWDTNVPTFTFSRFVRFRSKLSITHSTMSELAVSFLESYFISLLAGQLILRGIGLATVC